MSGVSGAVEQRGLGDGETSDSSSTSADDSIAVMSPERHSSIFVAPPRPIRLHASLTDVSDADFTRHHDRATGGEAGCSTA